ncbi:MAG: TetR/AcrR family transcriptional regulator [Spirochaetota bacterium]
MEKRVSKKTNIITTAEKLFYLKGYDSTSVDEIIEKVGLSKGTFYYYFTSKIELLNEVITIKTNEMVERINKLNRKNISAVEKLNKVFSINQEWKITNLELMKTIMKVVYKDENSIIRYKIFKSYIKRVTPGITKIIEQGVNEKVFVTDTPYETAELIILIMDRFKDLAIELLLEIDNKPDNLKKLMKRIRVWEKSVEKVLGLNDDTLHIADIDFINKFI